MDKNSVDIYYQQNFNLAKTLTIASTDSADGINKALILQYGQSAVDQTDKTTWKYYMNICGEYHPTDTIMEVISLDNLQVIEFTKANLAVHVATAEGYSYGTRYYYNLVSQYPEQEQLILGILYPANMTEAINADPGTILSYPPSLVESNEITLISELDAWIKNYLVRWNVKGFSMSDSLYQVSYHSVMYLQIVMKLLNLRLKRARTNEAHSFHITSFLASHYGLDQYMSDLTLEQQLFLYRNIRYIERNSGSKPTFAWLVDALLTVRNIPISEYRAKLISTFDSSYTPSLSMDSRALNTILNIDTKNKFTYAEFIAKETNLAPDNPLMLNADYAAIYEKLTGSPSSSIMTKALESSLYDNTDSVPHKLTDILFNEWIDLSSQGLYTAIINFTDPSTAVQYALPAEDAFLYALYLFSKAINIPLETVPDIIATKVRKTTLPTAAQMTALVDNSYTNATNVANTILGLHPTNMVCPSVLSFFNLGASIYLAGIQEWYQVANENDYRFRGQLWNMLDYIYCDRMAHFSVGGMKYSQWLVNKSLPDPSYTLSQYQSLILAIYGEATGMANVESITFASIQKTMLSILGLLSSYSIQLMQEANTSSITRLNWGTIRAGNIMSSSSDTETINFLGNILDESASVSNKISFTSTGTSNNMTAVKDVSVQKYTLDIETDFTFTMLPDDKYIINTWQFVIADASMNSVDFSNYSFLTSQQISTLVDIW